jgi:ribosome-associated protein
MPDTDELTGAGAGPEGPSKSALKRQMLALQALGETLVGLSEKQLANVPIEDERLREAIDEARGMKSHSARRRHLQLIGKLMRTIDASAIEHALGAMDRQRQGNADAFHQLENPRDAVVAAGVDGVELVLSRWPAADRQQLRQLLLQSKRESDRGKPPAARRKLFRYLKELRERYGESA